MPFRLVTYSCLLVGRRRPSRPRQIVLQSTTSLFRTMCSSTPGQSPPRSCPRLWSVVPAPCILTLAPIEGQQSGKEGHCCSDDLLPSPPPKPNAAAQCQCILLSVRPTYRCLNFLICPRLFFVVHVRCRVSILCRRQHSTTDAAGPRFFLLCMQPAWTARAIDKLHTGTLPY